MNEWQNVPEDISQYVGFVYLIICKVNGKKYIGKKLFFSNFKRKPLKGRKNKRCATKESDWRIYWGSCNELLTDLKQYGEDSFERKILHCHYTRWDWSYSELCEQIDRDVLRESEYYNGIIRVRLPAKKFKPVKLEEE
jgi:hypothetical protein